MDTILSILAITFGTLVVCSNNTIYSLMFLIGLFITAACLLIIQGITYIGILYIVVYVGAIAILFLFVVMMIDVRDVELSTIGSTYTKSIPITLALGGLFYWLVNEYAANLSTLSIPLIHTIDGWNEAVPIADNLLASFTQVEALGLILYTWGGLWLFIAALILLLCMVGPIVLTLQEKSEAPVE